MPGRLEDTSENPTPVEPERTAEEKCLIAKRVNGPTVFVPE